MTEISASLVKELREKSGAGMMDCKKALAEHGGNMDAAMDFLRKKGLASAGKKAGRAAAEGLVAVAAQGNSGVVVELNAETDFVARNDQFQAVLLKAVDYAVKNNVQTVEELKAANVGGKTVEAQVTDLVAAIGENMTLRRLARVSVSQGTVATYVHNALAPTLGKIGVLVGLESSAPADKLSALGRQIAMHIAATRPESLDVASLDKGLIERERAIYADKAKQSGKPADIIDKMVEGSLRKYYEQVVLLEQVFVIDGSSKISAVLEKAGKDFGAPVKLTGFVRFELGEGVEKKADDFASEVAKMAAG